MHNVLKCDLFIYLFILLLIAMGPMGEEVEVVLTRATVRPLVRVTASRATEATTRAPTAAPPPTAREDMAATVSRRQVEGKACYLCRTSQFFSDTLLSSESQSCVSLLSGGYTSPSPNQGGGGYNHSTSSYSSGGYSGSGSGGQPSNMSYSQQSSFSGFSQQPPPSSSPSG